MTSSLMLKQKKINSYQNLTKSIEKIDFIKNFTHISGPPILLTLARPAKRGETDL
jgi:hypothetical protein